jgi:hypothetical protein
MTAFTTDPTIDELHLLLLEAGWKVQSVGGDLMVVDAGKNIQLTKRNDLTRTLTPAGESMLRELTTLADHKLSGKRGKA